MYFTLEALTQSQENIPLSIHCDLSIVFVLMAIELGIGVLFGSISKEAAKLKAQYLSQNRQIFQVEDYNAQNNENRTPEKEFSLFGLDYSLVIAEYKESAVVREYFYTPIGDCLKVEYKEDGTWKSSSLVSAPTYISTVIFPILGGCVLCAVVTQLSDNSFNNAREIATLLGNFGVNLLVSGVLWFAGAFWIPQMISVAVAARRIYVEKSENPNRIESREILPVENESVIGESSRIEKFFWVFLSFGTICIALFWYIHSLEYTAQNPDLKSGYYTLILGFLFWANIPWTIMGISCIAGDLTFKDYLNPQSFHPYLIAFFSSILVIIALGSYWIFAADGAEMLAKYPGLFVSDSGEILDSQSLNPHLIKSWWCLGAASGVVTTVLMFVKILYSSFSSDSKL